MLQVAAQPEVAALGPRGLWVDGLERGFGHEHYYYFRKVPPWLRATKASPEKIAEYLYDPAEQRPMLVLDSVYQAFLHGPDGPAATADANLPPMVSLGDVALLLPGPYAVCSSEANRAAEH